MDTRVVDVEVELPQLARGQPSLHRPLTRRPAHDGTGPSAVHHDVTHTPARSVMALDRLEVPVRNRLERLQQAPHH
ncbi:hypothetical protein [Streptomyces sp. NPDC007856]|uniref:hypothetical protein n=1 Tax=Streptomyces sp. NPDC007856 TaxID=3364781 RepID=UPI0036C31A33